MMLLADAAVRMRETEGRWRIDQNRFINYVRLRLLRRTVVATRHLHTTCCVTSSEVSS